MGSKIINQFSIKDYLAGSGIYSAKDNGYYGMYSPFREDHNASMKVDYNKNLWIDYGTNDGGTLIDLVMRMENCSNGEAMQLLEQRIGANSFSFHREKDAHLERPEKQEQVTSIQKVGMLTNPSLLAYLHERCITLILLNCIVRRSITT
jgi:DNA primase